MKFLLITFITFAVSVSLFSESWKIKSQTEWKKNLQSSKGIIIKDNVVSPEGKAGHFKTKLKKFKSKKSLQSLTIHQSPVWQNWEEVPGVCPSNLKDAPVFLAKGPKDYWIFGRYSPPKPSKGKKSAKFEAKDTKLQGFNVPLKTTPDENQCKAPGGLE